MSRTEEKQATTRADDAMEDDDAKSEAAPQASTDHGPSSPEKQPEAASWWPFSIQMTLMIASMIVCVCCARYAIIMSDTGEEVWTKDRLAEHGPEARTICLGFLGEVFEVTKGARFYGKDGGYSFFSGRDATKAFITGEFEKDLTDVVDSFGPEECLALVDWADFYHKEYKYVAKLEGNFYDATGRERRALVRLRQLAEQGAQIKKEREEARKQIPDCSKKWSASEGGKVWCENGMFPRLLVEHHGGKPSERCACFTDPGWSDTRKLYKDCPPEEHSCRTVPAKGHAGPAATAAAPATPEHQEL